MPPQIYGFRPVACPALMAPSYTGDRSFDPDFCDGPELECRDGAFASPYSLGVVPERDDDARMAGELREQPTSMPWACSVEMNECRAECGVTGGRPKRAKVGAQIRAR